MTNLALLFLLIFLLTFFFFLFSKLRTVSTVNPLAGGANVTAADFAVFHVIDAVSENLMESMILFGR
jgi:multisubunit Na+/H+ antiporter MnhB subunit